jgi:hypothetical protein
MRFTVFGRCYIITVRWLLDTLCEGNACADVLAKMDAISNSPMVKISAPSSDLLRPLMDYASGVEFVRE